MYNEKLIKMSEIYTQINGVPHYKINNIVFRILNTEAEYVSFKFLDDMFWNIRKSEEFYHMLTDKFELLVFNKKPKELKGKKKIATIKKDRDWKVNVFIDDNFNLYYQDNHVLINEETKVVTDEKGTRIETTMNCTKMWFEFKGMFNLINEHPIVILNEMIKVSEEQYPKNTITDNLALTRLYGDLLQKYFKYMTKK